MKRIKYRYCTVLLLLCLGQLSCKEDELFGDPSKDALPKAEMVSVIMLDDETALLKGRITYGGKSAVEYTGFCFSQSEVPDMTHQQVLLDGSEGDFSAELTGLVPDSVFYFRCFAANHAGYAYGSGIIKLKVPNPVPPVVPCTHQEGYIKDNLYNYKISNVESGPSQAWTTGDYGIEASCYFSGGPMLRLEFQNPPLNGIYITTADSRIVEDDKKAVYVTLNNGFDTYHIESGGKVYVSKHSDGSRNVEFCDLQYKVGSSMVKVRANILVD